MRLYKTLLVDDEPRILSGLSQLMRWEDYGIEIVSQATNGEQALRVLENHRVHLLITDIKMPGMNGLELIRRAKELHPHLKCVILSGYDDFALVKEAAVIGIENYLLKPVIQDELSETLLGVVKKIEHEQLEQMQLRTEKSILRNNILNRWMMDRISAAELMHRLDLLQVHIRAQDLQVVLCKVLFQGDDDAAKQHLITYAVENIGQESLGDSDAVVLFCDLLGHIVILFHGGGTYTNPAQLEQMLRPMMANVGTYLKYQVFMTAGSIEQQRVHVHRSYQTALHLMEYSFIMPPNTLVQHQSVAQHQQIIFHEWSPSLENIKGALVAKNRVEVKRLIHDVYRRFAQMTNITPHQIHNHSVELICYMFSALQELKISTRVMVDQEVSLYAQVQQMKNIDELSLWLQDIAVKVVEQIEQNDEQKNPTIKRVLQYIDKHLSDNLSLKTLSAALHINGAYLGQLFIKETGETFSSYLNRKRIEEAKHLLMDSDLGLNEVASRVGYVNQSYFSQLFKKAVGVYPNKYRVLSKLDGQSVKEGESGALAGN